VGGSGNIALGNGLLTVGSDNGSTGFTGTISGSGGLDKVGGGTLSLGGANSYTGLTTVSSVPWPSRPAARWPALS
jgi:autotransporter-associated beta strand protein